MTSTEGLAGGLRAVTRNLVRQQVSEVAIDLFTARGFDDVTVEQVAATVGLSARSVHRYFPAKEDLVVGPLAVYGESVRDALLERPTDEPVWDSLHAAYGAMMRVRPQTRHDRLAIRLISGTPSLQARNLAKHLVWAQLLEPVVAQRLPGADVPLRARVIVQASLSTFTVALAAWADDPAERDVHSVLDIAFGAVAVW